MPEVLIWNMNNAYQFVFQCPNGHTITLKRKFAKGVLSEAEAMEILRREDVSCKEKSCRWHGKAVKAKLLQVLPFTWVLSSNSKPKSSFVRPYQPQLLLPDNEMPS